VNPFIDVPVVVGILWLAHAALGIAGHRAFRYSRWGLFAGLPVVAGAMALSGDMMGFVFALMTILALLGIAFLEVFLVMGVMVLRDSKARKVAGEFARDASL
jgi:putative Ca2+/H+ antiporter (TMEM165/GDT1 family)